MEQLVPESRPEVIARSWLLTTENGERLHTHRSPGWPGTNSTCGLRGSSRSPSCGG